MMAARRAPRGAADERIASRRPVRELADGSAAASGARAPARATPASDEVAHSHAISRAGWTARERRQGHPDRGKHDDVTGRNGSRQRAARGAAHERPCGIEVFGGILRPSRAAERVALGTIGVIERDPYDLDYAKGRFRCSVSANVLAREYEMWRFSSEILYVLACAPCRIVANPGKQLGLDDPEAYVTVASAADVANHFNAPFVVQENHANIVVAPRRRGANGDRLGAARRRARQNADRRRRTARRRVRPRLWDARASAPSRSASRGRQAGQHDITMSAVAYRWVGGWLNKWRLHGAFAWWLYGGCVMVPWWLHDGCMVVAWRL